jgi:hypothetical protein
MSGGRPVPVVRGPVAAGKRLPQGADQAREPTSGLGRRVRLPLDDRRPQPLVDPPLDRRAVIVGPVYRPRQRDELRAEIPGPTDTDSPL